MKIVHTGKQISLVETYILDCDFLYYCLSVGGRHVHACCDISITSSEFSDVIFKKNDRTDNEIFEIDSLI